MSYIGNNSSKYSSRDLVRAILKEQQADEQRRLLAEEKARNAVTERDERISQTLWAIEKRQQMQFQHKNNIMTEAYNEAAKKVLGVIYEASLLDELKEDKMLHPLQENIVESFITSHGAKEVLDTLKDRSTILEFVADAAEQDAKKQYTRKFKGDDKKVDEDIDDNKSFTDIMDDQDVKDDIDTIGQTVQSYVTNSVEKTIIDSIEDKNRIKNIMQSAQDKINVIQAANSDEEDQLKESYVRMAKEQVNRVNSRKRSLFEQVIDVLCKDALSNNRSVFMGEAHNIDMDKIEKVAKSVITFYTMAEACGFDIEEDFNKLIKK